jgi:hypothetical protein
LFAGHRWLMPVILATQEAEIRRIEFETSLGKYFERKFLGTGRVAQIVKRS